MKCYSTSFIGSGGRTNGLDRDYVLAGTLLKCDKLSIEEKKEAVS